MLPLVREQLKRVKEKTSEMRSMLRLGVASQEQSRRRTTTIAEKKRDAGGRKLLRFREGATPKEESKKKVARPEGLEPPTLCLEGRRSIH